MTREIQSHFLLENENQLTVVYQHTWAENRNDGHWKSLKIVPRLKKKNPPEEPPCGNLEKAPFLVPRHTFHRSQLPCYLEVAHVCDHASPHASLAGFSRAVHLLCRPRVTRRLETARSARAATLSRQDWRGQTVYTIRFQNEHFYLCCYMA